MKTPRRLISSPDLEPEQSGERGRERREVRREIAREVVAILYGDVAFRSPRFVSKIMRMIFELMADGATGGDILAVARFARAEFDRTKWTGMLNPDHVFSELHFVPYLVAALESRPVALDNSAAPPDSFVD